MKVLITGATGFIGKNLIQTMLQKQYNVHALVREDSDTSLLDKRIVIFYHPTGATQELIEYCTKEQFDGVIHLASLFLASHRPEEIPSLIQSNILLGTELLEACKSTHVKWFINTGTFWQHYDSSAYNPVNLYAATKEAFETIAKYYTETSDLIFVTLKLNDTFGPKDTRNKIFNLWQKNASSKEPLEMSAGEQIIDISFIDDVVHAYELLIEKLDSPEANSLNNHSFAVASDERMSLQELAKVFEKATGTTLSIQWGKRPYRDREVMRPWENGARVPGWKPKYTLTQAIQKTLTEHQND